MFPPKTRTSWRKGRKFILGKVQYYIYKLHSDTTSKMQILLLNSFFDACRCVKYLSHLYAPVKVNPRPPPPPREKAGTWTKELEKIVGSPGKYFHSNVLACPRLPVKAYAEVPIFIWKKCFKPVCFSIFLLSYIII